MAKPRATIASILSSTSSKQHLRNALESQNQAYLGLEEEETKEHINKLKNYIQCVILGETPFLQEKEKQEKEALKGLAEEVRALHKEVAPIKETYTERLKRDLPSLSSLPSLLLLSPTPTPSPFSRSSTFTKSKKKQL